MYSQNAITHFETKAQTFVNDNYMSSDVELHTLFENEACNALMHFEKSVFNKQENYTFKYGVREFSSQN